MIRKHIKSSRHVSCTLPEHPSCSGFTLLELCIAFALIAILVLIALPAIQSARESSRSIDCQNRLRNISLAILNYESAYSVFPSNFIGMKKRGFVNDHSAYTRILGQLDSASYRPNFSDNRLALARGEEINSAPLGLVCPSDPIDSTLRATGASYRFNMGVYVRATTSEDEGIPGAFEAGKFLRASEFSRGLSSTVGLSERPIGIVGIEDFWRNSVNLDPSMYIGLRFNVAKWLSRCQRLSSVGRGFDGTLGRFWNDGGSLFYNHIEVPGSSAVDCGTGSASTPRRGIISARSFHPTGINVSYMDGHVVRISDSIDRDVWQDMGSRH